MIKQIILSDLHRCLEIFHLGYEPIAIEFGLTNENCPDRGRASLPFEKLEADFKNGIMMFGYLHNNEIVGFLGLKQINANVCKINDIIVLPAYTGKGFGTKLLYYAKEKATELGAEKITLGMIDDNKRLKKWYEANGFINIEIKKFDKAPCTIGIMECVL